MSSPHVIVVGSLNRDVLLDVDALPVAGETVAAAGSAWAWGGKGANQAVAAARLGARTWFVGAVGDDPAGADALDDLVDSGVDVTATMRTEQPTGTAYVVRDRAGENLIVVDSGANHALTAAHVTASITALTCEDAVVLISCEIPEAAVAAAAEAAGSRGWTVVLNPAPARPLPEDLLAKVGVLTPNATEVTRLGRSSVRALLDAGVGAVVVTRGAAGASVHDADGVRDLPGLEVEVADSVGAGDAFSAAVAVGLASGRTVVDAARVGTAAGALAVTGPGARGAVLSLAAAEALLATGQARPTTS